LENLKEGVSLAPFTTFKIGGPARYFYSAESKERFIRAIEAARKARLSHIILGGGSNILVSDEGFDGLVIRGRVSDIKIKGEKISVGAGTPLGAVVAESIKAGLTGLEWAVGIPGTVGGALRGNAGAYGCHISGVVDVVEILDEEGSKQIFSVNDCGFGYRESIFRHRPWVILSARLRLPSGDRRRSGERAASYIVDRKKRIPPYPSAGCVFKNVGVGDLFLEARKEIPGERARRGIIPAWYLIDQCGLRGRRVGGAQISEEHTNIIVNIDNAKAGDVLALINLCKEGVERRFGVSLEEELCCIGFSGISS
jgi:UDP-N-acetylmuramate dehydrogenase